MLQLRVGSSLLCRAKHHESLFLSGLQRVVSEGLQGRLEELEQKAFHLQELCPTHLCPIGREAQRTLRVWAELQELLQETRVHVQQADRLRHFFKDYLAMM